MFRFTPHGKWEMIIGTIVLVAIGEVLWHFTPLPWLSFVVVPIIIWLFAFFRDPERAIPPDAHLMVSPADGLVSDITEMSHDPLLEGPSVRVGIFLNVFNVHVNRSPCDGRIVQVIYKRGKFINAMHHNKASEENESNTIVLAEAHGEKKIAVVKQIVGLIARRIVCPVTEGTILGRGQRYGMIKFGSRTELYIPKWLEPAIQVKVGDKVRGGCDIIARLARPADAPMAEEAAGSAA
jgi:phosphatidylserine decarboxylase